MSMIMVTGGSGFLGSHCVARLLRDGHRVRTTLRRASREDEVRDMMQRAGAPVDALSFAVADLTLDAGWAEAVAGCDYVLHVASPFPSVSPRSEDEVLVPARDGSLRVLRAARDAGVRRVVLTSSFAAVGYDRASAKTSFDETDWTSPAKPNPPYIRSKTIAERAAWDFIAAEGGGLELTAINPSGIFGPALGDDISSSLMIVKALLEGDMPGLPDIHFGVVDVRDVADLHIRAMTSEAAAGERFIAVSGPALSMRRIARILRDGLGTAARHVPTRDLANWKIRLAALFSEKARQTVPNLGRIREASARKAVQRLGWRPRSGAEAILASAESLLELGLVKGV